MRQDVTFGNDPACRMPSSALILRTGREVHVRICVIRSSGYVLSDFAAPARNETCQGYNNMFFDGGRQFKNIRTVSELLTCRKNTCGVLTSRRAIFLRRIL